MSLKIRLSVIIMVAFLCFPALGWGEKKDEWRTVYFPPFVGSTLQIYLKARTEKGKG